MFRRVYTKKETDVMFKEIAPILERYTQYFAATCNCEDLNKDLREIALAKDLLELSVLNGLQFGQTMGYTPEQTTTIIRANIPLTYVNHIALNPAFMQGSK